MAYNFSKIKNFALFQIKKLRNLGLKIVLQIHSKSQIPKIFACSEQLKFSILSATLSSFHYCQIAGKVF